MNHPQTVGQSSASRRSPQSSAGPSPSASGPLSAAAQSVTGSPASSSCSSSLGDTFARHQAPLPPALSSGSSSSSAAAATSHLLHHHQQLLQSFSVNSTSGFPPPPPPVATLPPSAIAVALLTTSQSSLPPILEEQTDLTTVMTATAPTPMTDDAEDCTGSGGGKSTTSNGGGGSAGSTLSTTVGGFDDAYCCCLYCDRRDRDGPSEPNSATKRGSRWRDLDLHGVRFILPERSSSNSSSTPAAAAYKYPEVSGLRAVGNIIRKIVWVLLLFVNLAAFVYCVADCIMLYFNAELSGPLALTGLSSMPLGDRPSHDDGVVAPNWASADRRPPGLPAVTVCNLNPLRLSELARRHWPTRSRDWSYDGKLDPTVWNGVNASSLEVFNATGHQLDAMLLGCIAGRRTTCSRSNFTRYLTPLGLCYTLRPSYQVARLQLVLNAESYEYTDYHDGGTGLLVTFHNPEAPPPVLVPSIAELHRGIRLSPGTHAHVNIRHGADVISPASSRDNCRERQPEAGNAVDDCLINCRTEIVERRCSCKPFWAARTHLEALRQLRPSATTCNMKQHITCVIPTILDLTSTNDYASCTSCEDVTATSSSNCQKYDDGSIEWDYSHSELLTRRFRHHSAASSLHFSTAFSPSSMPHQQTQQPSASSPSYYRFQPSPQQSSYVAGSSLPAPLVSTARLVTIAISRCKAGDAAAGADVAGRHVVGGGSRDVDEIMSVRQAVEATSSSVDRLKVDFRRSLRETGASLVALRRRLEFHVESALGGVRRAFVTWFSSEFDSIRERSLSPLVAGSHEIVAHIEQTVKQLTFTPATETVARKVLYYMTDSMLSGKLETAIQALDNVTKLYYSFLNADPLAVAEFRSASSTPTRATGYSGSSDNGSRRYDQHLIPDKIMSAEHDAMKRHYTGISENVAGLIENILVFKTMLKDVHSSASAGVVNQTAFDNLRKSYIVKIQQIRYSTAQFQTNVIDKTLSVIDGRINEVRQLNDSITSLYDVITSNVGRQISAVESSAFTAAYGGLMAFVGLADKYTRSDSDIMKSTLCEQGLVERTATSITTLIGSLSLLKHQAADLRSVWNRLTDVIRTAWSRLLQDDLVRRFYEALYNDAADPATSASGSATTKQRPIVPSGGNSNSGLGGDASQRATGSAVGEQYDLDRYSASMNADIPLLDFETKMAEVVNELKRLSAATDSDVVLGSTDRDLERAFAALRRNLETFRSDYCEPPSIDWTNIIRDNVVVVDLTLGETSVTTRRHYSPTPSSYRFSTVLSHVGGLMAFFLGASLVTLFELIDICLCSCGCRGRRRYGHGSSSRSSGSGNGSRQRNRKRGRRKSSLSASSATTIIGVGENSSNHISFRPPLFDSLPSSITASSNAILTSCINEPNGPDMTSMHGGGANHNRFSSAVPKTSVAAASSTPYYGTPVTSCTLPHPPSHVKMASASSASNDVGYRSLKKLSRKSQLQAETDI